MRALFVSLGLVCSLVACGGKSSEEGESTTIGSTTDDTTSSDDDGGSADGGSGDNGGADGGTDGGTADGGGAGGDEGGSSGDGDSGGTGTIGGENWDWVVGEVGTLAGNGVAATVDGAAGAASFFEPKALSFAPDGSLVVVEGSGAVRRILPDGSVSTVSVDEELRNPSGVVVAADGAIFVSDADLDCIVRIDGSVTSTFAGTCGRAGFADGAAALFDQPRGLAWAADGALLVADVNNMRIRSVSAAGEVSTIAGIGGFGGPTEGAATEASVYLPFAVAVDDVGDIWFSGMDHCIRRISGGVVSNVAGLCANYSNTGDTDGAAADARFDSPWGLWLASDQRLFVADTLNDRIRVLSADRATVSTVAGGASGYVDGDYTVAQFAMPRGVAEHADGWLAIADSANNRIRFVWP